MASSTNLLATAPSRVSTLEITKETRDKNQGGERDMFPSCLLTEDVSCPI